MIYLLISLNALIISQCTHTPKQQIVYLKYKWLLFLIYTLKIQGDKEEDLKLPTQVHVQANGS